MHHNFEVTVMDGLYRNAELTANNAEQIQVSIYHVNVISDAIYSIQPSNNYATISPTKQYNPKEKT